MNIKEEPELRHALAHIYYAIEALSNGHAAEALYELKSIEGLVFWDSDDDMTKYTEKWHEKLQKQEEKLQEKEVIFADQVRAARESSP